MYAKYAYIGGFMSLRKYLFEEQFKMIILPNKIDVINYVDIDLFNEEKIIIRHEQGLVILNGKSLTISKLLDKELLVKGNIEGIEFR